MKSPKWSARLEKILLELDAFDEERILAADLRTMIGNASNELDEAKEILEAAGL